MMKIIFKRILASDYSFAKRWSNKSIPETLINGTLHIFLTKLSFLAAGFYFLLLSILNIRIDNFYILFAGMAFIMLLIGYGLRNQAKKAIDKWKIPQEHKSLSKQQRLKRNTMAFFLFFICFYLFIVMAIKFI